MRQAGRSVALFDTTFVAPAPGFAEALERHRPRLAAIVEDNFNFLTKMCLTQNREHALGMIRDARHAGAPVLVNGSDATDRPEIYARAGAEVLPGQPEPSLLREASKHLPPPNGSRPPAHGPAWDLLDLSPYRRAWRQAHGRFSLHLVSSRGCSYRRNWCAKPICGADFCRALWDAIHAEVALNERSDGHGVAALWRRVAELERTTATLAPTVY